MSDSALQDEPTTSSENTAGLDLDWLSLEDGEEIRWASTPHKYSIVPALVVGLPLSVVLIGIPLIAASYLQYTNTNYVVTNKGLYSKRGILSRDVQQIGFDKVQNISYSQSAIGSSLGYGSVDVSTAGGSGVELQFRSIPNPAAVQELISKEIDKRQQRDSAGTAETDDVLDQILVELRAIRSAVADDEEQVTNGSSSSADAEASPNRPSDGTVDHPDE
ncbi:hypothetical protein DM2_1980 [Halorubrum sp. DM2]|uniref:PH domain-containing protein n=1 Tax=Halorubrum sp. DM2 TaxID=2527867 RepID=UPI0024B77A84|nr:PH domain-containing protein [Halorubrum sp. DM2]VTT85942.1 hypothetical protein DM2_1980 [Halorubrum sp. DM2]